MTPRVVARWYKLLYLTPALFVIYTLASKREGATYPKEVQRRIGRERMVNLALHLLILAALLHFAGLGVAFRVYLAPLFLAFPIAFTLNRLGQHYDIDPKDPVRWSTLVNPSRAWDYLFLWSNLHLEHHYFPRVPFYNLKALNRRLQGFYRARGVPARTYRRILWEWLVKNRAPHTNWLAEKPERSGLASSVT